MSSFMKRESLVFIRWNSTYGDYGDDHLMLENLIEIIQIET